MPDLVPIKVKIPLNSKNGHLYPDFNSLPADVRGGMDWSYFFDRHGIGWHYDKLSGHGEMDQEEGTPDHDHVNNDPALWYGVTCVPADFAEAAVAQFPGEVQILTEASFERFYNERSHVKEPEILEDLEVLQKLNAREVYEARKGVTPDAAELARRERIMDPNDSMPGLRVNRRKTWEQFKVLTGVSIRAQERKP